jgi:hypothetical protein
VTCSIDEANDDYWTLNIATKRIVCTRDANWLDTSYKKWVITNSLPKETDDDDIEDFK